MAYSMKSVLIVRFTRYDGHPAVVNIERDNNQTIEAFALNGGQLYSHENGTCELEPPTFVDEPTQDAAIGALYDLANGHMLKTVSSILKSQLESSKSDFIATLNQVLPHSANFMAMRNEISKKGGPLGNILTTLAGLETKLDAATEKMDENARVVAELKTQLEERDLEIRDLIENGQAKIQQAIEYHQHALDELPATLLASIRDHMSHTALPSTVIRPMIEYKDEVEKFTDHNEGVQQEATLNLAETDFGLTYTMTPVTMLFGDVNGVYFKHGARDLAPGNPLPGHPFAYRNVIRGNEPGHVVTRAMVMPDDENIPNRFPYHSSPFGQVIGYMTINVGVDVGHIEISYDQREKSFGIRGHSSVLRHVIRSTTIFPGVSTVVVQTGETRPSIARSRTGHIICSLSSTPGFEDVSEASYSESLVRIAQFIENQEGTISEVFDHRPNLDDEIARANTFRHVLKRLPDNVNSPVRHDVLDFLAAHDLHNLHDGLLHLTTAAGQWNATHDRHPTFEDLRGLMEHDEVQNEVIEYAATLYHMHSRAVGGMPKPVHVRAGYMNKTHYRGVQKSSATIMVISEPGLADKFVCPACGCAYATPFERQLCNVVELALLLTTQFEDGMYPTVLMRANEKARHFVRKPTIPATENTVSTKVNDFGMMVFGRQSPFIRVRRDLISQCGKGFFQYTGGVFF